MAKRYQNFEELQYEQENQNSRKERETEREGKQQRGLQYILRERPMEALQRKGQTDIIELRD